MDLKIDADICPICNGTGKFKLPFKMKIDNYEIKKQIALELHKRGYSMRQIQKALNYKNVRSIHKIIHDEH